ncbi:MAG: cyclic nucleotide-binding domain-containing protein [Deltaproteobacteria bacterium]|nr:cyclic nucleotide-binding domain-containing protein [Deltaproteobacteria bacterium]MBT7205312.1 cyclic nucleotide-binding domain-containing protein [Deltaproteobacteria bacterium]
MIEKTQITTGVYWVAVPQAQLRILCGCPADSVKHLMKKGLIQWVEKNGVTYETGPNAILLSDLSLQNGHFANLAEFPVLQMLYRQGIIIPNHPNNTGHKPILIGQEEIVRSQMNYIYRGNYGLISLQEIEAAGISPDVADEMMRMKLRFAFGNIRPTEDLLEDCIVRDQAAEIRNGVLVLRLGFNIYEFSYEGDSVQVDLNLSEGEAYETPYELGAHQVSRDYFAITHSGEGDGWDTNRPCMASIVTFQGRIYLIDAGPNISHSLNALGINVNEIEGIFHTHAHDDHFAGLTSLIRSDHRIKYYSTRLVRESVTKKLAALMSIDENQFNEFFEVHDLEFDTWNNVNGLEVFPVFSPHPVETNILFLRTLWKEGHVTYAHLADITAFSVLEGMISDDPKAPGISRELYERTRSHYLTKVNLKKIDIGGGMIHGLATDFRADNSTKIVLSHTAGPLSNQEKEIGSGLAFGMTDVLIPGKIDYYLKYAAKYLHAYYPMVPESEINMLLNCPRVSFSAGTILLKNNEAPAHVYLILTGSVEFIRAESKINNILSAGSLAGDMGALFGLINFGTYRAASYIETLQIPSHLFEEFVARNRIFNAIQRVQDRIEFMRSTPLFGESVSYPIQTKIAQVMEQEFYPEGSEIELTQPSLVLIRRGQVELLMKGKTPQIVEEGEFCGEETILGQQRRFLMRAVKDSRVYKISDSELLREIPIVRWKLLERSEQRNSAFWLEA